MKHVLHISLYKLAFAIDGGNEAMPAQVSGDNFFITLSAVVHKGKSAI